MMRNRISNQTMTEVTNTAWLLIKGRKSFEKHCEKSGKQQQPKKPKRFVLTIEAVVIDYM